MFALQNRFRHFKHGGQVDSELGPVSRLTRDSNESTALPHNSVDDRKTQTGPFADRLRGKKWFKDSYLETEAGAVPSDDRLRLHDDEDIRPV